MPRPGGDGEDFSVCKAHESQSTRPVVAKQHDIKKSVCRSPGLGDERGRGSARAQPKPVHAPKTLAPAAQAYKIGFFLHDVQAGSGRLWRTVDMCGNPEAATILMRGSSVYCKSSERGDGIAPLAFASVKLPDALKVASLEVDRSRPDFVAVKIHQTPAAVATSKRLTRARQAAAASPQVMGKRTMPVSLNSPALSTEMKSPGKTKCKSASHQRGRGLACLTLSPVGPEPPILCKSSASTHVRSSSRGTATFLRNASPEQARKWEDDLDGKLHLLEDRINLLEADRDGWVAECYSLRRSSLCQRLLWASRVLACRVMRSGLQQLSAFAAAQALSIAEQQHRDEAHERAMFAADEAAVDFNVQQEFGDVERDVQVERIQTLEEDSLRSAKLLREISSKSGEQLALIRILTQQLASAKTELRLKEVGSTHLKSEVAAAVASADSLLIALA